MVRELGWLCRCAVPVCTPAAQQLCLAALCAWQLLHFARRGTPSSVAGRSPACLTASSRRPCGRAPARPAAPPLQSAAAAPRRLRCCCCWPRCGCWGCRLAEAHAARSRWAPLRPRPLHVRFGVKQVKHGLRGMQDAAWTKQSAVAPFWWRSLHNIQRGAGAPLTNQLPHIPSTLSLT